MVTAITCEKELKICEITLPNCLPTSTSYKRFSQELFVLPGFWELVHEIEIFQSHQYKQGNQYYLWTRIESLAPFPDRNWATQTMQMSHTHFHASRWLGKQKEDVGWSVGSVVWSRHCFDFIVEMNDECAVVETAHLHLHSQNSGLPSGKKQNN